jgi:hypothetical protein
MRNLSSLNFQARIAGRFSRQKTRAVSEAQVKYVTNDYGVVRIKFTVHKPCEFGLRVGVVGNLETLGSWDSSRALQLDWSDGHMWYGEAEVPLGEIVVGDDSVTPSPGAKSIEYKYVIQSSDGSVHWMEGENLHIPSLEYGTTALLVQDSWGYGYREIQFERLAEESMLELLRQEEMSTKNALGSMVQKEMKELSRTLAYCEQLELTNQDSDETMMNADRELAAATQRLTSVLRADEALYYLDSV